MPIDNFDDMTFVAFLDISGFKELMRNKEKACGALDTLYQAGYGVLGTQNNRHRVEGIFISDSGLLFVRRSARTILGAPGALRLLLEIIKRINERMLHRDLMLTVSIAFGEFRYQVRREFEGIGKTQIYGNAYTAAFLDNENGKPKIQPGQCRIVKDNLPGAVNEAIGNNRRDRILRLIKERDADNEHYYFYWMVDDRGQIEKFEQQYRDAYNLKYAGILKALKRRRY